MASTFSWLDHSDRERQRMAFGQARQDNLLRYLQDQLPESEWARIAALAAIDISPAARGAAPATPRGDWQAQGNDS